MGEGNAILKIASTLLTMGEGNIFLKIAQQPAQNSQNYQATYPAHC